ncbi:uncharacterized protein BDR25DRAFT_380106 [Lindgomyces ingoldianus]|uniref:Uncharacterized protein n=1 Tax=Lindgomyces ingoldianus TaxID=673940 RepID=A0ACB6QDJ4_9PLEO|nr:uncharacterized protein BDR25DRAFT_380106 [Lindgomyces ingoldianus]KAF2465043.1 hypothetical protein BDR25DRAFT_380106 [Lindgomyces ingoldianus]
MDRDSLEPRDPYHMHGNQEDIDSVESMDPYHAYGNQEDMPDEVTSSMPSQGNPTPNGPRNNDPNTDFGVYLSSSHDNLHTNQGGSSSISPTMRGQEPWLYVESQLPEIQLRGGRETPVQDSMSDPRPAPLPYIGTDRLPQSRSFNQREYYRDSQRGTVYQLSWDNIVQEGISSDAGHTQSFSEYDDGGGYKQQLPEQEHNMSNQYHTSGFEVAPSIEVPENEPQYFVEQGFEDQQELPADSIGATQSPSALVCTERYSRAGSTVSRNQDHSVRCEFCGKLLYGPHADGNLKRHQKSLECNSSEKRREWPCDQCHKVYQRSDGLLVHKRKRHGHPPAERRVKETTGYS